MVEAEEVRNSNKESRFPRDLLKSFTCGNQFQKKYADDEEGNVELSLGLSLNGRFGLDPQRVKPLIRASSVSNFTSAKAEETSSFLPYPPFSPLTRACSLPTEAEEWRKRKELQTLRRLEAKRKRVEKMKGVRAVRERVEPEQIWEENGRAVSASLIDNEGLNLKNGNSEGFKPPGISSQASIGSQGSGSSGVSDFESQPIPVGGGADKQSEGRSPAREKCLPDPNPVATTKCSASSNERGPTPGPALKNPSSNGTGGDKGPNEMVRSMLADMPCVSTKGEGPNGKRIEGFLYRYRKGEEVRIVCVCHGSFLSPAEFVKHGGGGDVAHPLKHIVVSPPSFL